MDPKTASTTGEQFQRLYYEAMDKRRHVVPKFYLDNAVLCWNGHGLTNIAAITDFYNNLAQTTHQINTLDAIPVPSAAVGQQQQAVVVHVSGNVRIKNESTTISKTFTQSFILTQQEDKWKIVSDTFRTQNVAGAITL